VSYNFTIVDGDDFGGGSPVPPDVTAFCGHVMHIIVVGE
jgi:hypothetical protein